MQKVPQVSTGSPNLLSPHSYYLWYQQHHGLQDSKLPLRKVSRLDRIKRVLEIYRKMSEKILQDVRTNLVHDESEFKKHENAVKSRIDNKVRVNGQGQKYISINGLKFDGSDDMYEEHFQSGKRVFSRIIKQIAEELISVISSNAFIEEDKSDLSNPAGVVAKPKDPDTIAVDLDSTLVDENEEPIPGGKEALQSLKKDGFKIAIFTARFDNTPKEDWQSLILHIKQLLSRHEIPFDEISIIKPTCKYYIDDRGITFTTWKDILSLISSKEALAEDGPQNNQPSMLQKSKVGSSGVLPETETSLTKEAKRSSFELLSKDQIQERFGPTKSLQS